MNKQNCPFADALRRQSQAGQTLLEILLAFGVTIVILSSIIVGILISLSSTQYAKNQGLANSYAQEGLSVVRQMKESDWSQFVLLDQVNYCLDQNATALVVFRHIPPIPCDLNISSDLTAKFSREVVLEHNNLVSCCRNNNLPCDPSLPAGSKVTVTVSWADGKCPAGANTPLCHKVELNTCFSSSN